VARRLLLDTNVLLVLLVGSVRRDLVCKHPRTRAYDEAAFDLLGAIVRQYPHILLTPHILAETTNLLKDDRHIRPQEYTAIIEILRGARETQVPKDTLLAHPHFVNVGAADSSILEVSGDPEVHVLTADLELWGLLKRSGRKVTNFNHIRFGH
jgi:hypothetical protein